MPLEGQTFESQRTLKPVFPGENTEAITNRTGATVLFSGRSFIPDLRASRYIYRACDRSTRDEPMATVHLSIEFRDRWSCARPNFRKRNDHWIAHREAGDISIGHQKRSNIRWIISHWLETELVGNRCRRHDNSISALNSSYCHRIVGHIEEDDFDIVSSGVATIMRRFRKIPYRWSETSRSQYNANN